MPAKQSDLIDRYLNAVSIWLPGKQQKDILAELAEDLHSQVEEREAALGRPLEEADLVDLLKRRGSPMRVASGYIPELRLINPAMLPLYRLVLKIVLLWVLLPLFGIVFIGPVFNSAHPATAFGAFLGEAFRAGFLVIGIVTTIFALMDRYHSTWVDQWDPRKLPRVPSGHPQMQWYNDFAGFAFGMAAVVFWAVTMWHRSAIDFTPALHVTLGAIWGQLYWAILGLTTARALVDLYSFVRRGWTRGQSWSRITVDVAGILLALVFLRAGNWVDLSVAKIVPEKAAKITSAVGTIFQVSFGAAAIVPIFDVVKQWRRLHGAKNGQAAPVLTVS
ncbi:MAG: hypothetical protein WDO73_05370 [Ignavibacteriota bacterium]